MTTDVLEENRRSCRYEAVWSAAYLGWWEGDEFRCQAALLRNLSEGGALVDLTVPPPEADELHLCLADSAEAEWADATRVSVSNPRDGAYRIRLAFRPGCPYALFSRAVFGIATAG